MKTNALNRDENDAYSRKIRLSTDRSPSKDQRNLFWYTNQRRWNAMKIVLIICIVIAIAAGYVANKRRQRQ